MRDLAAQIYGVLAAHGLEREAEFDKCISKLHHDTMNKKTVLEQQHGQILAMAHAVERLITIFQTTGTKSNDALHKWPTYKTVVLAICK